MTRRQSCTRITRRSRIPALLDDPRHSSTTPGAGSAVFQRADPHLIPPHRSAPAAAPAGRQPRVPAAGHTQDARATPADPHTDSKVATSSRRRLGPSAVKPLVPVASPIPARPYSPADAGSPGMEDPKPLPDVPSISYDYPASRTPSCKSRMRGSPERAAAAQHRFTRTAPSAAGRTSRAAGTGRPVPEHPGKVDLPVSSRPAPASRCPVATKSLQPDDNLQATDLQRMVGDTGIEPVTSSV
jgi:hypothetical protein